MCERSSLLGDNAVCETKAATAPFETTRRATISSCVISAGDADAVDAVTPGLGLHRGLGFQSAPDLAGQQQTPATAPAPSEGPATSGGVSMQLDGATAASAAAAGEASERGSDSSAGSAGLLDSGPDLGDQPPIMYNVAFPAGLGSGGAGRTSFQWQPSSAAAVDAPRIGYRSQVGLAGRGSAGHAGSGSGARRRRRSCRRRGGGVLRRQRRAATAAAGADHATPRVGGR